MRVFLAPANNSFWHGYFKYEPATGMLLSREDGAPIDARADGSYAMSGAPDLLPGCLLYVGEMSDIPVHRIVWRMFKGPIPKGLIVTHKNGDLADNRLANLELTKTKPKRGVSGRQRRVCKKVRKDSNTGYIGVTWVNRTGRYKARITIDGKRYELGQFNTALQAARAYQEAKKRKEKA